jgi:hypothetical protein
MQAATFPQRIEHARIHRYSPTFGSCLLAERPSAPDPAAGLKSSDRRTEHHTRQSVFHSG